VASEDSAKAAGAAGSAGAGTAAGEAGGGTAAGETGARENRLGAETSPYLRQHRHDPVDWYPWGPEAFARAEELDRPLFLSIGYSACHWCHVMAHESFADEATAEEMNRTVVAVKVDREERPDVDAVYMEAVQAASGHGGWPMSVFATPDGRPFYTGTYFPKAPGRGAPTFRAVLAAIAEAWANERDAVLDQAGSLSDAVARRLAPPPPDLAAGAARHDGGSRQEGVGGDEAARWHEGGGGTHAGLDVAGVTAAIAAACRRLAEMSDPGHGGFGRAPKFPQPLFLDLLLHAHAEGIDVTTNPSGAPLPGPLDVALGALEAMASGGIWDHVGGGFSRYSVDREWLVPHFEKMLYDEALLARVYLHAWQITGDGRWRQVLGEIVSYVLRDLALPGGGVASAEDADSEGAEGLFYTWTPGEIEAVLGPELASDAIEWWGVRPGGNFEGRSILFRAVRGDIVRPPAIEEARRRLLDARSRRVRPSRDDKILTEWNAMMCATLAEAALATGEPGWREASEEMGELLIARSRRATDGRLLRCPPRHDGSELLGYSTDAAWLVEACVRLAECTGESRWLHAGGEAADQLLALFEDTELGGLFTTGADAERLVVRPRELYDNVTPSALSVAVGALARLAALSARADYEAAAERLLVSGASLVRGAPTAVTGLLVAADLLVTGIVQVAVTGERPDLISHYGEMLRPRAVLAWDRASSAGSSPSPLLVGRAAGFAYVCRAGACRLPAASAEEIDRELGVALAR
jgi:uncharacterized protein YyaL (SSP411 family)